MEKEQILKEDITIKPYEYCRLWCGELTERDFSTSSPNPRRIEKIAYGVEKYLAYKRKQLEECIRGDNT